MRRPEWWADAACLGAHPGRWFASPIRPSGPNERTINPRYLEALTVCADCPVREACADWANLNQPTHGMWAGKQWSPKRTGYHQQMTRWLQALNPEQWAWLTDTR